MSFVHDFGKVSGVSRLESRGSDEGAIEIRFITPPTIFFFNFFNALCKCFIYSVSRLLALLSAKLLFIMMSFVMFPIIRVSYAVSTRTRFSTITTGFTNLSSITSRRAGYC